MQLENAEELDNPAFVLAIVAICLFIFLYSFVSRSLGCCILLVRIFLICLQINFSRRTISG